MYDALCGILNPAGSVLPLVMLRFMSGAIIRMMNGTFA